jgi:hypothetical protein
MTLTTQRIFSALALIAGILLFFIGMNASHAVADKIGATFFGRFTYAGTWYILGGIVVGGMGLYLLLTDLFAKKALPARVSRRHR